MWILVLSVTGAALSWAAMLTYFLVVPRWPDLRDSGLLNVLLASGGVFLGLAASVAAFVRRRRRWTCVGLAVAAVVPGAFLPFYVYHLSYQLPSPDSALRDIDVAPNFRLADQHGNEHALDEYKQWVLVDFFRGPW